jgi:hypothetical protein
MPDRSSPKQTDYDNTPDNKGKSTYKSSCADLDLRGSEVDGAVTSSHDSVGVDQNTTAKVRALRRQTDDVGELAESSGSSSDDISATRLNGSSESESGQHKG